MRFYGIWLATLAEQRASNEYNKSRDVIDVESEPHVVEPEQIEDATIKDEETKEDEDIRFDR